MIMKRYTKGLLLVTLNYEDWKLVASLMWQWRILVNVVDCSPSRCWMLTFMLLSGQVHINIFLCLLSPRPWFPSLLNSISPNNPERRKGLQKKDHEKDRLWKKKTARKRRCERKRTWERDLVIEKDDEIVKAWQNKNVTKEECDRKSKREEGTRKMRKLEVSESETKP